MQDVSNLRQVLAQTQVVQRTQENARRRGEIQQQAIAKKLEDRVDIQGRHVEESPETVEVKVDPDAERKREEQYAAADSPGMQATEDDQEPNAGQGDEQDANAPADGSAKQPKTSPDDDSKKGSVIDLRA